MAEVETPIETLRDRLTGLLADWGAEFSMVLKELEAKRARLKELEASASGTDEELVELKRQLEGHEDLVKTLKADAEEASKLRRELHGKDLELERLKSELGSRKELIGVLRIEAQDAERFKEEAKTSAENLARLRAEKEVAERRAGELSEEIAALRESSEDQSMQESIELEAVKAELEARKTLISSLRADVDRLGGLEASLEEKRQVIAKLEGSMNRQAGTIADLRQSVSNWQQKHAKLKAKQSSADTTSTELPVLSDTDLLAIESLEEADSPDRTIAIDMRESLLEARRSSQAKK